MAGFTDEELGLTQPPAQQPAQQGFSDDDLGIGVRPGVLDYLGQAGNRIVGAAAESSIAQPLRGIAARQAGLENSQLEVAIQAAMDGADPAEAMAAGAEHTPQITRPVTEQPLYQAGEAVTRAMAGWFPDRKILNPVVGDVLGGIGSVAGNIATSLVPGVGPAATLGATTFAGGGEAAQRAVASGATPEQQARAGELGAGAGILDLADIALARNGVIGQSASRMRRALARFIEGGAIEATTEGAQQFIQNLIARGIYKPDQDLSEEVLYNALIGGLVGGAVRTAVGSNDPGTGQAPPEAQIDAIVQNMNSGVPNQVSGITPATGEVPGTSPGETPGVPSPAAPSPVAPAQTPGEVPPPVAPGPSPQLDLPLGEPAPAQAMAQAPPEDTTGLRAMGGGMASAITDNLYDALWSRVEAGEVTETGGQPSALMQAAQMVRSQGGLTTQAEFKAFAQEQSQIARGPNFQRDMQQLVAKYATPAAVGTPISRNDPRDIVARLQADFDTTIGQITADRTLPNAVLFRAANEYANTVTKYRNRSQALDEIRRAKVANARFLNKIAPTEAARQVINLPTAGQNEVIQGIDVRGTPTMMRGSLFTSERNAREGGRTSIVIENAGLSLRKILPAMGYKKIPGTQNWRKQLAPDTEAMRQQVPIIRGVDPAQVAADRLDRLATQKRQLMNDVRNFGDLQYLSLGANGSVQRSPRMQAFVAGNTVPTQKEIDQGYIDSSQFFVPQSDVDPNQVILHDNTVVEVSSLERVPITLLAKEKFGERFDEFALHMGEAFIELRDVVADIDVYATEMEAFDATGDMLKARPWARLRNEAIGVSFDPEYRGVSIRVPFSGSFLNIAAPEFSDIPRASVGMVGTMVHELAHHNVRSHDAAFPAEMQRILLHLDTHPQFDFLGFKQRVIDVMVKYQDVFQYLNGVVTSGTFPVFTRRNGIADSRDEQAGDGSPLGDVGASGLRTGGGPAVSGGVEGRATPSVETEGSGPVSVSIRTSGVDPLAQQRADTAVLARDASGGATDANGNPQGASRGLEAVFRQPATKAARERIEKLFEGAGGPPAGVKAAASHADRMNRWYQYMAGLDQLHKANPYFKPLRDYFNAIQQMHNEEATIQDAALRISKDWRSLGDQGERLASMFDDVANMRYRTADEVRRGIERHPTRDELRALISKHQLDQRGVEVFDRVRRAFDAFLEAIKGNAIQAARGITSDPTALTQRIAEIENQIAALRARPYFPLMRHGRHFVMKKDAAGRVVHFETFERRGIRSAQGVQKGAFRKMQAAALKGEKVTMGILPESSTPFMGLPNTLLDQIKTDLALTSDQLTALEQIQLMQSPALSFKRMMKSDYIPGYSMDFKRGFAKYFFHGARYYARTKHGKNLRNYIAAAGAVPNNKANLIRDYMQDHLQNTILDAKGDFGILKGAIFLWAMGYSVAAATMNLTQTPVVTYSHLAGKFGGFGLGNKRAAQAILKAAADVRNFYTKETYKNKTKFEFQAMEYGIQKGRISETQAPELAGISSGESLIQGIAGNAVSRKWTWFMEKGAFAFEMAEQFNRRVAYRAALDLAMKFPNAKAVKEAMRDYEAEYQELLRPAPNGRQFSPAEAAAVVTANHIVDQTQFIYAKYARPRFMRGRLSGTIFVFQKYLQSMLFWMGQNKSDVLPQALVTMMLLYGASGAPGYEDLKDLIRAFAHRVFGKNVNLDQVVKKAVMDLTGSYDAGEIALYGLSRMGFGVPAVLDMMGSWVTGVPGRGLTPRISGDVTPLPDGTQRQGRGQNVPYPVLDRHRAGQISLPVSVGKLLTPQSQEDLNRTIAEQTQRASGAVFGLGFNVYKTLMSEQSPTDLKRYEPMVPRALGQLSRAYRAYSEGRERGRGGPNAAPTIVPYDVRDSEQMMEVIFMGLGYQNLRQNARWDNILAHVEIEKFYEGKRNGLFAQYDEARLGGNEREINAAIEAIRRFNEQLPEGARGQTITSDALRTSLQGRARTRALREQGLPLQRRNIGISHEIDQLYQSGAVDVVPRGASSQ